MVFHPKDPPSLFKAGEMRRSGIQHIGEELTFYMWKDIFFSHCNRKVGYVQTLVDYKETFFFFFES